MRTLFEDIATSRMKGAEEEGRLMMLASLDRLRVSSRIGVGRYVLDARAEVLAAKAPEAIWRLERIVRGTPLLNSASALVLRR